MMTSTPTARPLSATEMVPNSVLRDLAKGDPRYQPGDLSPEHTAIVSTYASEIFGELLAHRALAAATTPPAVQRRGSILRHLLPTQSCAGSDLLPAASAPQAGS